MRLKFLVMYGLFGRIRQKGRVIFFLFAALLALPSGAQNIDTSKSNYKIGVEAYHKGDFIRAFDAWSLGAYEGNAEAQYNLAVMYLEGKGVNTDKARAQSLARAWFVRAATQDHAEAQYNLGHMALDGIGGKKDLNEALLWWQKAAEGGYAQAQFNYGRALYLGIAGKKADAKKNESRAFALITLAAKQGEQRAITFLAENKQAEVKPTTTLLKPARTKQGNIAQGVVALEPINKKQAKVKVKPASQPISKPAQMAKKAKRLETGNTAKTPQNKQQSNAFVKVIDEGSSLRRDYFLRSGTMKVKVYSDTSFKVQIDTLEPKTLLKVMDKRGDKFKIELAAGLPAWVKRQDVLLQDNYASTYRAGAKLYDKPNGHSLAILPIDLKSKIIKQQAAWIHLRVPQAVYGWIDAKKVSYAGENSQALFTAWARETQAMAKAAKMPQGLVEALRQQAIRYAAPPPAPSPAPKAVSSLALSAASESEPESQAKAKAITQVTKNSNVDQPTTQQTDTAIALGEMNNNAWLFEQSEGAHVLHLFTLDDRAKALKIKNSKIFNSQAFKNKGHLFSTRIKQADWFFLLLGAYPDAETALAAKATLPRAYRKWSRVREIGLIAKNRCKKRAKLSKAQAQGLAALCR